ncbi:MAG: hypothetical protein ACRCTA_05550, partial [Bacilli bacterium]
MKKNILTNINILYLLFVGLGLIKLLCFTYILNNELALSQSLTIQMIATYLLMIVIYYSSSLVNVGKANLKVLLGLNIILSIILFIDLVYYRGFESFISIFIFSQYKNVGAVESSITNLISVKDAILFVDSAILLLLYKKLLKLSLKQKPLTYKQNMKLYLFPLISFLFVVGIDNIIQPDNNPLKTANQYSVLGYHYFDIVKYATSQYQMLTKSKVDDTIPKEGIKAKNDLEVGAINYNEGQLKGKNLVYIQVESLETFLINLEVEGKAITTNLNRLLANSYYFSNVVTQTDLGNSSDADFLANTSFLPIYRGSISYRFADNSFN